MNVAALVALTVAATQALKAKLAFIPPVVIVVVVSLVLVVVKAFESGGGGVFNLALLWTWFQVILGAVGAYKLTMAAASKVGAGK